MTPSFENSVATLSAGGSVHWLPTIVSLCMRLAKSTTVGRYSTQFVGW